MKITSRVTLKVVFLALLSSFLISPEVAQAADICVPDKIEINKFSIHPGQSMGLLLNGQALTTPCTTTDPGIARFIYGDRDDLVGESVMVADFNSWKWKDFTYEYVVSLFKDAGKEQKIDAQKVLSFNFYRIVNGTADLSNPLATIGIVLDPTTAGPCHPDLVEQSSDFVSPKQGSIEILNGVKTLAPCSEFDPGWVGLGYIAPGSNSVSISQLYFDQWTWGGEVTYKYIIDLFTMANVDTTKFEKDSMLELRFFRGGDPKVYPADLSAYTLVYTLKLQPPTAAEIAAEKAAADKKIADEKAAADKLIADEKAAADKVIADKAAADKAAAAAKAAAAKKSTITCVKGKLTKKVTAVKPVCPKGYKKKQGIHEDLDPKTRALVLPDLVFSNAPISTCPCSTSFGHPVADQSGGCGHSKSWWRLHQVKSNINCQWIQIYLY